MAAQDAELKLRVSLDLGFFRQQLAGLGQAAAGYNLPLQVKFDRKGVQRELRNLDRAIGKKTINVALNLAGGLTKDEFGKIKRRLDDLRELRKVEIPISVKNGATGKDINDTLTTIKGRIAASQQIKQGGGKLRIATSIKPSITNADVADFKRAIKDKFAGISVKVNAELGGIGGGKTQAQIERDAMAGWQRVQQMGRERMGGVSEAARRESLKQSLSGRNIGELKDIGSQLGVGGVGRFKNTQNLIQKIVTEASVEMITKYLDPQAVMRNPDRSGLNKVLDTFARGLFGMLGMDVASMRQQMAERRALPGINFPATVPSRSVSIGPSSTGRALPPGATREALPGTAFGSQRYLPTALGDEMKRVLREAANAFLDTIRAEVRKVNVRDIGAAVSRQPLLGPGSIAGMLPAAVGREPSRYAMGGESREQMMARRTAEAYARSALRGVDVMGGGAGRSSAPYSYAYRSARPTSAIVPYATGGAIVPSPSSAGGAGIPPSSGGGGSSGGMGGLGNFARAMGGINLPGAGVINELGQEFGFATKQVLLFGQAYKLLGFLQSFPGEVGAAVGALQSYRNTLDAVTPSAEEARASNELLLGLMDKYNIPLQSARDGFTKLYASMAPAGFSGDEIRSLFTGISKAAATFGMSADKVDRVNYAFAQMASKGQVMSEELKGQLGDVLPGSMALFAKAAGFEGPKAIQDFSVALEAGAYKGEAMVALLKNVTIVMNKEFGPGAEGAALTFQGIMSRMQNSVTLLYESFEPVAVGFLNTVVVPLTSGIKQVTDGISAFMSGTAAKTSGGFALAQELEKLRPAFSGIGQNVAALVTQLAQFANVALQVGKVFLQIAGNPFVGYLARVYINVLALTTAIQLLNLRALIPMIASFGRSVFALITFTAQCVRAGQAVQVTGLMMRTFFATTGVGLLVVGIGLLIERFTSMNQALEDTKTKALGAAQAIRSMSQTEARREQQIAEADIKELQKLKEDSKGKTGAVAITQRQQEALQRSGTYTGRMVVPGQLATRGSAPEVLGYGQLAVDPSLVKAAILQRRGIKSTAGQQIQDLRFQERQAQGPANLVPIPPGGGDDKDAKKAAKEAETQANQQQQRAIDAANRENALNKAIAEGRMALDSQSFEHQLRLIDARNNYELAGLNSIEAQQEKFQQDLKKLELDRIATVRKAEEQAAKAALDYSAAQNTAAAAGEATTAGGVATSGGLPSGIKQYITGDPSSKYYMADHGGSNYHEHLEFATRALAEAAYQTLTKAGVQVTEFKGYGRVGDHTQGSAHYAGRAFDVPGAQVPVGKEKELTARVQSLLGFGGAGGSYTRQRRTEKAGGNLQVEQQQMSNQLEEASRAAVMATNEALAQREALIKSNMSTIFPVAEQQLENDLMKVRNQLQLQGMPKEYIDYQEKVAEVSYKMSERIKRNKEDTDGYEKAVKALQDKQQKGIKLTLQEEQALTFNAEAIKQSKEELKNLTEQQKLYQIAQLESAIATMKNADALKAMEETSGRINDAVGGISDTYKGLFKELAMGADSVDALKKAQQALADQALTMIFDFAMKPMEDFMKNTLSKMFGVPTEKEKREESIKKMEEQLTQLKLIETNTAITAGKAPASGTVPAPPVPPTPGQTTAAGATGGFLTGPAALQTLPFNGQTGGMLQTLPFNGESGFLSAIGIDSEALSTSFTDSANVYSEQLSKVDTSVLESATALGTAGTELGKEGAAGKKWHESLGQAVGGLGMAAGSIMGIAAGINQIKEGGTSNVLGGIGTIASMAGSLLGSFSSLGGLFSGGAPAPNMGGKNYFNPQTGKGVAGPNFGLARGGIMHGGFMPFRAFANGGIVTGPTMGLVGEGRYSEAVVPLPDGKSIPVQLGGGSSRDLLGGGAKQQASSPVLSMSFQSTTINGVEYVDRAQLESAMAETRRLASRDGASRGSQLALSKLKNSPNTRRQLGLG